METFCKNNDITVKHGAPRTPTTQGLIERSNRSCKEDMHTFIVSTVGKNISNWCKYLGEVSYTQNISYHTATKTTPYEAVYGMKPHREVLTHGIPIISDENSDQLEDTNTHLEESINENLEVEDNGETSKEERQTKRLKISENQTKYNEKMVQQSQKKATKKCNQFKVGDVVSIKIDKVDKASLFHPNMLLGKIIEIENQYARVVTKFGQIQTLISPKRLNLCTATNLSFDYSKEISYTIACKKANIQTE